MDSTDANPGILGPNVVASSAWKLGRKNPLPRFLRVVLTNEILKELIPFMMPQDAVEFLACHPHAFFNSMGWTVIKYLLKMETILAENPSQFIKYKNDRDLMLHVIRKYGLCCSECFTILDGPNGFFCCTSLCKSCSFAKFCGCSYVDSVVRFYLCGSENITVKGKAFLIHPFWWGDDDESAEVLKRHGTALNLAELIYEEKMFFAKHASSLDRPRDDKTYSLKMMLLSELKEMRCETKMALSSKANSSSYQSNDQTFPAETKDISKDDYTFESLDGPVESEVSQQSLSNANSIGSQGAAQVHSQNVNECTGVEKISKEEFDILLCRISNTWGAELPGSLRNIYDNAVTEFMSSLHHPIRCSGAQSFGTMPLRDLVKNLHGKNHASTKILTI